MEEDAIKELATLEGVGKSKAKRLYDAGFKTIEAVTEADVEDIAAIKGIGAKLAEKIKESAQEILPEEQQVEEKEVPLITIALDRETKRLLDVRKKQKGKKPVFLQSDSHKKKKLADYWRKPRGIHNKTRYAVKGKCPLVKAGYGSPTAVRGLHPSGFEEVMVNNTHDLELLDVEKHAARIGRTVGARNRDSIEKKAAELKVKVLNPTRRES